MNKQKLPIRELFSIIIGEALVSSIICLVYLLIKKFTYKVILGAALGSVVTVLNFLVLSIMAGKVIDRFIEERGEKELSEEEAEAFALKFQAGIQKQMKLSFLIRTLVLAATLVVAFLLEVFEVLPTVIPILALRPILMLAGMMKKKGV